MKKYELAVAYRIYPKVSKVPFVHPHDKLRLTELGVKSFKESLSVISARIFFILDNCPPAYEDMILRYFSPEDIEFVRCNGIGNLATFGLQMDLLLKQKESEYVFFVEDDYLFLPGSTARALHFLRERQIKFVTLYDHIDNYTLAIHLQHKYKIVLRDNQHWRTAASTCMTFLTRKKVLIKTKGVFRSYCRGNWDSSLWFALTKKNVLQPSSIGLFFSNRMLFKSVLLSWMKTGYQIVFGEKFDLWQPVPSLATHMEITGLAPVIDWQAIAENYEKDSH
jgi:hypothetical protein